MRIGVGLETMFVKHVWAGLDRPCFPQGYPSSSLYQRRHEASSHHVHSISQPQTTTVKSSFDAAPQLCSLVSLQWAATSKWTHLTKQRADSCCRSDFDVSHSRRRKSKCDRAEVRHRKLCKVLSLKWCTHRDEPLTSPNGSRACLACFVEQRRTATQTSSSPFRVHGRPRIQMPMVSTTSRGLHHKAQAPSVVTAVTAMDCR